MQEVVEQMAGRFAELAEKANAANEDDYYGDDGLLYCHICNTPKQCKIQNPFYPERVDTRFCMCKCKREENEREERRLKSIELESDYNSIRNSIDSNMKLLSWLKSRDYEISKKLTAEKTRLMQEICFGEDDLSEWTFANAMDENEKAIVVARNYVENYDNLAEQGKGIIFYGEVGTGKSFAAACIANALLDKDIPVRMTNFGRIANELQGTFEGRQEYIDSFNRFPLLILDDLAAERKTEFMQEIVFQIIDARIRSGLPLIVTTNLTSSELKNPSEMAYKRTFSRLLEMCHPVKVEGEDKRKMKLKRDFKAMDKLLGI